MGASKLVNSWFLAFLWLCLICPSVRAQGRVEAKGDPKAGSQRGEAVTVYGTIKWRHAGHVKCVAYTADGGKLISGGSDGFMRVWDRQTGTELKTTSYSTGERFSLVSVPTCLALSPDGRTLLWGARGGVYVAAGAGEKSLLALRMSSTPTVIVFSKDGATAAIGSKNGDLLLWDVTKRELIHQWKIPAPMPAIPGRGISINAIAFSAEGKTLFSGAGEAIQVWDLNSKMRVKDVPLCIRGRVKALSLAPDGKSLAAGGAGFDGKILVLDGGKLGVKNAWAVKDDEEVDCLQYSVDGKCVIAGLTSGMIQIFDARSGKERACLDTKSSAVDGIALSPRGSEMASIGSDCTIHRWDLGTMQEIKTGNGHTDGIRQVVFSDNGGVLASCSDDHTVRVWSVKEALKEPIVLEHPEGVLGVAFAPGGKELLSGCKDEIIRTWEWEKARVLRELTPTDPPYYGSMSLSPDGQTLAFANMAGMVGVYELRTGKAVKSIKAHAPGSECGVEFSGDGRRLLSVGLEGVKLWETTNWTQVGAHAQKRRNPAPLQPHFAPDGKSLAFALDGRTISIFEIGEGWKELYQIRLREELPKCFSYSPDGRIFAVGTAEGTVRLWNSTTTERLGQIRVGRAEVNSLAFSPDGKKIGAGLSDSTVVIADVTEFTERAEKK